MRRVLRRKAAFFAFAAAAALAACGKDEIVSYQVPKEAEAAMGPAAMPAAPAAGGDLAWTVPRGWKSEPAAGMRFASFDVPAAGGNCELSVVVLPGDAGGELANVNRWRGQLGAGALDDAALAAAARRLTAPAGKILAFDIKGEGGQAGKAMAAAILSTGEKTWFFKLTGKEAAVAAARPSFQTFLKSLRPGKSS